MLFLAIQVNGKGKGPASDTPDGAPSSPNSASTSSKGNSSLPVSSATTASTAPSSIHSVPLPTSWPQAYPHGPGYHNLGNTCFLNSVLQSLTHTAPLVACLMGESYHSTRTCTSRSNVTHKYSSSYTDDISSRTLHLPHNR